jgi:hypothetical protein
MTLKKKGGSEYHLVAKADTQDGYISTLQKYTQTYTWKTKHAPYKYIAVVTEQTPQFRRTGQS